MRKGKRTFIVFALLLLLSVNRIVVLQNAQAEESINAFLSGENKAQAGQPFSLTFGLRGVSQNIFAQDLTFTYDSEQLDFIGAESLKEGFSIVGQSETPDRVRIISVSQGADHAVNRDSDLLTLRWLAKPLVNPAAATVSITNLVVSNGEGVEIKGGGVSHTIQITMANKAGLLASIANAQTQHDTAVEGTAIGQYPAGSKTELQAVIGQAKTVADNPAATEQQIEKATTDLDAALRIFIASVIKSLPADLNGDNRFTIGDLGIAVAAYGKTSADPDWAQYQIVDVNHDGKVDIEDLAFIARAILNVGPDTPNKPVWSVEKQLNVFDVTSAGLTLTWSGAADPAGVTGYKVYQDGREFVTVAESVYHVTGLTANKLYTFKVEAGNASGLWSTDGPGVTVTTLSQPANPPSVVFTGPESVESGIPFDLTYGLSGVSQSIYAQKLTLTYDPKQLNFIGAESLREGISVVVDSQTSGRVHVIASSQGADHAVTEDGNLLSLRWNAKPLVQPAIATVTITDILVSNGEGVETRISGASQSIQISTVDKTGLLASIANAQMKHDAAVEGTSVGQYPAGSKAIMQAVIDRIKAVADDSAATEQQVQEAAAELDAALQTFIASVHKPVEGDLNGDNRNTVGDLAIVAAAYGGTSTDPEWAKYMRADVDHDGKVDIEDLAIIASLILS